MFEQKLSSEGSPLPQRLLSGGGDGDSNECAPPTSASRPTTTTRRRKPAAKKATNNTTSSPAAGTANGSVERGGEEGEQYPPHHTDFAETKEGDPMLTIHAVRSSPPHPSNNSHRREKEMGLGMERECAATCRGARRQGASVGGVTMASTDPERHESILLVEDNRCAMLFPPPPPPGSPSLFCLHPYPPARPPTRPYLLCISGDLTQIRLPRTPHHVQLMLSDLKQKI